MATAKHKFQKLVFNPENQKLVDFLDELQKLARDAFGIAAHPIIEQFIHAERPPHLKKSINQAHLEIGTYEQIVTHLERELELNGLEDLDELQINTVSHNTTITNADRPKLTCQHCTKPGHYRNQCRSLKTQKQQSEKTQINPGNKNSAANNSVPNNDTNKQNNNYKNSDNSEKSQKLFIHPVTHVGKQTTPQTNATMEPTQRMDHLPGTKDGKDRTRARKEPAKMIRLKLLRLQPKN